MSCTIRVYFEGDLIDTIKSDAETQDQVYREAGEKVLDEIDWSYDVIWPEDEK